MTFLETHRIYCVTTEGHGDVYSLCCTLRSWWHPGSYYHWWLCQARPIVLPQQGLLWYPWLKYYPRLLGCWWVYTASWIHIGVLRSCCHLKPKWWGWSAMPPEAMLVSMNPPRALFGSIALLQLGILFIVCTVTRNYVEAHKLCSCWL